MAWNDKIEGIARIDKCVGEYDIWDIQKSPYGKFKVKVFYDGGEIYTGYSNLRVADGPEDFCSAVGHGFTEEEALKNTIYNYLELVSRKEEWEESEFECADPFDF